MQSHASFPATLGLQPFMWRKNHIGFGPVLHGSHTLCSELTVGLCSSSFSVFPIFIVLPPHTYSQEAVRVLSTSKCPATIISSGSSCAAGPKSAPTVSYGTRSQVSCGAGRLQAPLSSLSKPIENGGSDGHFLPLQPPKVLFSLQTSQF